jgi:hemoglobin-like flavoprotein
MDARPLAWSLERVSETHGDPAAAIYARFFEQNPSLGPLFVLDHTGAIRGNMLAHVFNALMDMEGPREYGLQFFRAERVTHDGGLGVTPADYQSFLVVVRDTVRDMLGPEWTPAVEAAWREALAEIEAP